MEFITTVGIEIHCELNTKTKMFSSAPNTFGSIPNTSVSVVDMAFPGIMPVVNKKAVEYAIMASTALNMSIDELVRFDRKNYFYPDLPKGYQITQQFHPIGSNGYVDINVDGNKKRIGIERLHMEEDTAKQLHMTDYTLINYNRCGVPLIEIVSRPDISSGKEAAAYVEALRSILLYCGVSDCKMEEGSMRCDVNVSIRPSTQSEFGTKTEIKNLNSISNVMKAIDFEVERQKQLILSGHKVEQETRRFDESTKQTVLMRKKSGTVDYKYFPEANIMPIKLDHNWVLEIINSIPELPIQRLERYINELKLNEYDANLLVNNKELSDYFELVNKISNNPKQTVNWINGQVSSLLNKENISLADLKFKPIDLANLIIMVDNSEVSSKQAKEIFEDMAVSGNDPKTIAKNKNMTQISDTTQIYNWVKEVIESNPNAIEQYKAGRTNILGFLVGQVIKKSLGKANPAIVNKIVKEEIEK